MNSTIRLRRGSLRRTQTIVGTSSTSIAIEVMRASCSEAKIASVRSGYLGIDCQYSRVREPLLARVENSIIAPRGTRKKIAASAKTTYRKTCSLIRRVW